jgi:hypothetical protein
MRYTEFITTDKGEFMFQKALLIIFIGFYFTGCGDSGGGDKAAAPACTKPIQSLWTAEGGIAQIDMRNVPFDTLTAYELIISGTGSCVMDIFLNGDNCSGTVNTINSTFVGTGSDPGCASLNGLERYTIQGSRMSVCDYNDSTDCGIYE